MKTKESIIRDIKNLLDELLIILDSDIPAKENGSKGVKGSTRSKTRNSIDYSGGMGGIMYLLDQGFFTTPKGRKEVIEELKREGRHYPPHLISMNLLALTRKRSLTRLRGSNNKGWVYVIRK